MPTLGSGVGHVGRSVSRRPPAVTSCDDLRRRPPATLHPSPRAGQGLSLESECSQAWGSAASLIGGSLAKHAAGDYDRATPMRIREVKTQLCRVPLKQRTITDSQSRVDAVEFLQ